MTRFDAYFDESALRQFIDVFEEIEGAQNWITQQLVCKQTIEKLKKAEKAKAFPP